MGAVIPLLFLLDPGLGSQFLPGWDSPGYDFFAYGQGEILYEFAGKIITLMATFQAPGEAAVPYRAHPAINEPVLRHATLAPYIFR
jgi:hypothetical protein